MVPGPAAPVLRGQLEGLVVDPRVRQPVLDELVLHHQPPATPATGGQAPPAAPQRENSNCPLCTTAPPDSRTRRTRDQREISARQLPWPKNPNTTKCTIPFSPATGNSPRRQPAMAPQLTGETEPPSPFRIRRGSPGGVKTTRRHAFWLLLCGSEQPVVERLPPGIPVWGEVWSDAVEHPRGSAVS